MIVEGTFDTPNRQRPSALAREQRHQIADSRRGESGGGTEQQIYSAPLVACSPLRLCPMDRCDNMSRVAATIREGSRRKSALRMIRRHTDTRLPRLQEHSSNWRAGHAQVVTLRNDSPRRIRRKRPEAEFHLPGSGDAQHCETGRTPPTYNARDDSRSPRTSAQNIQGAAPRAKLSTFIPFSM